MSKTSPAESPKKDSTRRPVLGKFGNFFNSTKKRPVKGGPDSPTSPSTEKTVTTYKSEKEIVKQGKKVHIVVTTSSKVKTQVGSSTNPDETPGQHGSKDSALPVAESEKETTNGNGELPEQKPGLVSPVKDTLASLSNALSASTEKLPLRSTPKFYRQTSIEKSAQASPARRRSSTDGETAKSSVRRLSQDELPKTSPRKVSKFTGKVTDSKYKLPDKPLLKLGSTERLNATKVTSPGERLHRRSSFDQSLSPDSVLKRQSSDSGTLSPPSPSEGDILTGSFQEKSKSSSPNGHSSNTKVLSVDIYLSKNSGNSSPTSTQGSTDGESMEKQSPNSRKVNRKRRSTKSQSSQNEDKKPEMVLQDEVFDERSFKAVQETPKNSDSGLKSAPLSPESNGPESSSQDMKAGANTKVSPKAESDKDKQHHPASSPMRKRNPTAWPPPSPTGRKALVREPVFRNQAVPATARVTEQSQPAAAAAVTTTQDAYVEKASVPGTFTGSGGEEDLTHTAAAAGDKSSQNNCSTQESIQAAAGSSDSHGPNQPDHRDDATPKDPLSDSSKSTITSQLNIPAKPKNVELPIKPKAANPIDEPPIEVRIPKGTIANKVSLFESKKTSHRQIDFYATKNISQPKKFVERAKLNFGKQTKGNALKESSVKPAAQLNANGSKKTENDHTATQVDADENEKPSTPSKQSEDSSVVEGIHKPMEEGPNGVEKEIESKRATVEPLEENEENCQSAKITSNDIHLTERDSQGNGLEPTINQEENLPRLAEAYNTSSEGNTSEQNSSGDIGHIDMGNKPDSEEKQPDDDPVTEEPTFYLANDGAYSDHVKAVTSPFAADEKDDHKEVTAAVKKTKDSTLPSDFVDSSETAISSNDLEKKSGEEDLLHSSEICANKTPLKMSGESGLNTVPTDTTGEVKCPPTDAGTTEEAKVSQAQDPKALPPDHVDSSKTVASPLKAEEVQIKGTKEVHNVEKAPEKPLTKPNRMKPAKPRKNRRSNRQDEGKRTDDVQNRGPSSPVTGNAKPGDKYSMSNGLPPRQNITQERPVQLKQAEEREQESSSVQEVEKEAIVPVHDKTTDSLASNVDTQSDKKESLIEVSKETKVSVVHSNESSEGEEVYVEAVSMPAKENTLQGSPTSLEDGKQSGQVLENNNLTTEKLDIKPKSLPNSIEPKEFQNAAEKLVDSVISTSQVLVEEKSQEASSECDVILAGTGPNDHPSPITVDNLPSEIDPSPTPLDVPASADRVTENPQNEKTNASRNVHEEITVHQTELNNSIDVIEKDPVTNGYIDASETANRAPEEYPDVPKTPESSFNISVGREDNTLDSSSDMEIFAETIRKLESPINLPQKRKKARTPKVASPYFGLPPIHENYLEKVLDSDAFSFGLGKKDRTKDLAPMALFKLQSKETAEKLKPKRASAEQSMLMQALRSQKEPLSASQETSDKESTDVAVKKSRIESLYTSRKTTIAREETVFSPTVTTVSTMSCSFDTPRKELTPSGTTCDLKTADSAKTAQTTLREELLAHSSQFSQPIPVLSMETHPESKALVGSLPEVNGHRDKNHSTTDRALPTLESTPKMDKPDKHLNNIFYFNGEREKSLSSSLGALSLQGPQKINPRPGKLVILTEAECGGAVFEVFSDIADCSSWELSPTIFIKTIRGCWLLYEHPNFEGKTIALEEGDLEVSNPWGEELKEEDAPSPVVIGSLRHVVKDYRVCQIDLFTDPGGLGVMASYFDDTEEIQSYGRLQRTCSIKVHWGVWMIYEEAGFQGIPFILEPGEFPDLSFWNTQEAFLGSLRPLKMGSRKVELPNEPKVIIFEKPMFEGRQAVLDKETLTFEGLELQEGTEENAGLPLKTVGSMRVISGLWVGYEKPGYEGHQYLLEEGDYEEWSQWGGYNGLLQSLRPILADFTSPHMVMYNEKDFDEKATNINVLGIIANMDETGFGVKIQSINVLSGVWVAYECPDFTGEQYILEKGLYSTFSDWGAKNCKISSVQPIVLEHIESPGGHFKVEVFSEPNFLGQSLIFEEDLNNLEVSFTIKSIKVCSGRWTVHDQADFAGNLWVLEEGIYPNLCSIGCPDDTNLRSLKIINYEFSEPHAVLYGKENFKGRKVKLTKESRGLQAQGYSPDVMSLEVLGGIWVLYEHSNYRGRQLLISPSKVAQWKQYSGWNRIGSLRPLEQKRLHFKLRNKANGMVMATNGTLDDIKLLRIQVAEDSGAEDQIWVYQKGVFRCRVSDECSLASAGTLITAGTKLGLNIDEPGTAAMIWSISPEGRIHSRSKPNLVLDIKGGSQYDQHHVVLGAMTEGKLSQLWEICVL